MAEHSMDTSEVHKFPMAPSGDFEAEPPILTDKHIYLAYGTSNLAKDWAKDMREALERAGYEVIQGYSGERQEKMASDIKRCMKVVMLVDSDYIKTDDYLKTIRFVEILTAERRREVLIPFLSRIEFKDLPHELKYGSAVPSVGVSGNYPKAADNCYENIVKRVAEEVPILSTVTSGVAYGLAWGHYFGYLHLILQGLSERIRQVYEESGNDWDCSESAEVFPRMVEIVPTSLHSCSSLTQYDEQIVEVRSRSTGEPIKVTHSIDFPCHPKKDYSCTMFKTTVNGKEYVFCADVPTTLNTLAKMRESEAVQFTDEDHEREITRFQASLESILMTCQDEHAQARKNSIRIFKFNGSRRLSEMIAAEIDAMRCWGSAPVTSVTAQTNGN